MGRFGPQERTVFLAIKAACYRGLSTAELLTYVGDRIGGCTRADATCSLQLDPVTALPIFAISRGWTDADHRTLAEHVLLTSPAADPGRLIEQGRRTILVDDVVPTDRPYYRDPYFAHHLLARGYRHELQTVCTAAGRGQALLTVTRREAAGSFELRHVRLLDAVAPHIAAGIHAATVRESRIAPAASETGVIVLDGQSEVEMANAAGERWLSASDASGRPGRLWALHALTGLLARSLTPEGATLIPAIEMADPADDDTERQKEDKEQRDQPALHDGSPPRELPPRGKPPHLCHA